ncbi:IS200/IS605 family transposase [Rhodohalobacter sp. 8-1]|uniref:IS200/IS605 family transposase n=1 Tax=Rhodohalobacter sp. 8-1 TaxID=3131972 RepID=UPI0030EB73F3
MANTYFQNYVHTTFPVKYRRAKIQSEWRQTLFGVMGNLINDSGCKTIIVNGVEDHVHCFFGFSPIVCISDVMRSVKAKSSKWINQSELLTHRFEWQPGFGSFTLGHSHVEKTFRYIQNQGKHHQKMTFKEEYLMFLKKFEIDYDDQYIFTELI